MNNIQNTQKALPTEAPASQRSTNVIMIIAIVLALIGTVLFGSFAMHARDQAKIEYAEAVRMGACSAVLNIAEIMDERKMDVNSPMLSQAFYDSRMPVSESVETGLSFGIQRIGDHEFAVRFNKIATHNFPEIVKAYSHITVAQAMARKCP